MKKWLLIWNIILTVLMMVMIFGGCSSAQTTNLQAQLEANKAAIEQLKVTVVQQAQQIQALTAQVASVQAYSKTYTDTAVAQLTAQIQQYVQQYVQSVVGK